MFHRHLGLKSRLILSIFEHPLMYLHILRVLDILLREKNTCFRFVANRMQDCVIDNLSFS